MDDTDSKKIAGVNKEWNPTQLAQWADDLTKEEANVLYMTLYERRGCRMTDAIKDLSLWNKQLA